MNRQYVKLLICSFIVLSCISCNSKKAEKNVSSSSDSDSIVSTETDTAIVVTSNDTLTFSVYQKKIEAHLNNDAKMPYCDFNINMVYPSGLSNKEKLKKLQAIFIENVLGAAYAKLTPVQAGDLYTKNYINDYKEEMQEYINGLKNKGEELKLENENWMNYSLYLSTKNLFNKDSIWCYSSDLYTYTGGAHGMSGTTFQVIDMKNIHIITLKDVFAAKDSTALTSLLKKQLAKDEKVSTEQELENKGYWLENLVPTENFYVNAMGLTWLYNPYEIAPYAMGTIQITLNYNQIMPYILPNSPIRRIFQ